MVGKKEAANEAEAQFMALSKPRVHRCLRHSSTRFRVWHHFTGADDRQEQQLNEGEKYTFFLRQCFHAILFSFIL